MQGLASEAEGALAGIKSSNEQAAEEVKRLRRFPLDLRNLTAQDARDLQSIELDIRVAKALGADLDADAYLALGDSSYSRGDYSLYSGHFLKQRMAQACE
jgi:hypothetical protein